MVQMAALTILTLPNNKGKIVYLISADKLVFKEKVTPGHRLYLYTRLISWKRGLGKCVGEGRINKKLACSAEFTLILPEKIKNFNVKM